MSDIAELDDGTFRGRLRVFLERASVRNTILVLVILNAVLLGLSTSDYVQANLPGVI